MKLFLIFGVFCLYILAIVNAAAIDTVVEEQKDTNQDEGSTTALDSIDQDCHQPREVGRCFALFHRYAFNPESSKCEEFVYGGCGGNQNNFNSLEECERKCVKKNEDEGHTVVPESNVEDHDVKSDNESESSTESVAVDKST